MNTHTHFRYKNALRAGAIIVVIVLASALLTAVVTDSALAADKPGQGRKFIGEEGAVNVLPMAKVYIEKKFREAVVTVSGERYDLSSETIIVGLDGKQVSTRDMLFPCDAEITYERRSGARMAQRITILRIARDASWKWTDGRSE